jgi:ferredoxin-NADP reductase
MALKRTGEIVAWRSLSPILSTFRVVPEPGTILPPYQAGQYIALTRDDCLLTRKVRQADGSAAFVPDLDESGTRKRGTVTHSYSVASAPFESRAGNYLEFYVILERTHERAPGRLTESLFRTGRAGRSIGYHERIVGDFTLEKRARGLRDVLFVGTGTGLAPLRSMINELWHARSPGRFTLLHVNRTREELGYHDDLLEIEASRRIDFVYVPAVSRPDLRASGDPKLGAGRANNLLRRLFGMPTKEEEAFEMARRGGGDFATLREELERTVQPRLPPAIDATSLRGRLDPSRTVVMTCGNPALMADVALIATTHHFRFEKEDW